MTESQQAQIALQTLNGLKSQVEQIVINQAIEIATLKEEIQKLKTETTSEA
jgi:hypothetical protein